MLERKELYNFIIIVIYLSSANTQRLKNLNSHDHHNKSLNDCIQVGGTNNLGICFGSQVLKTLNQYNDIDNFSLVQGITFTRSETEQRDYDAFLDKDPLDFKSMLEGASNLISKRSLHWDLSRLYPGLTMRVAPTLANGLLEFIIDPKIKDRGTYYSNEGGELGSNNFLARNFLVPLLLGFKFQLSTLLPLLLGLILFASKKAFFLAKLALIATTLFSSSATTNTSGFGLDTPMLSSYTMSHGHNGYHDEQPVYNHHHHGHRPFNHNNDYYFKKNEATEVTPITPIELKEQFERLFITKDDKDPRTDIKKRDSRQFIWTTVV